MQPASQVAGIETEVMGIRDLGRDEAELWLESSNQGRTWFIKEHRLLARRPGLGRSYETLQAAGIELCMAEMKDPVKDKLKRFGLLERFGEGAFFATIDAAVAGYLKVHPVEQEDRQ